MCLQAKAFDSKAIKILMVIKRYKQPFNQPVANVNTRRHYLFFIAPNLKSLPFKMPLLMIMM